MWRWGSAPCSRWTRSTTPACAATSSASRPPRAPNFPCWRPTMRPATTSRSPSAFPCGSASIPTSRWRPGCGPACRSSPISTPPAAARGHEAATDFARRIGHTCGTGRLQSPGHHAAARAHLGGAGRMAHPARERRASARGYHLGGLRQSHPRRAGAAGPGQEWRRAGSPVAPAGIPGPHPRGRQRPGTQPDGRCQSRPGARHRRAGRSGGSDLLAGNLQASYELDLFGKLAKASAAARADLQTQQALAAATALAVAANTASGYLNLRGLDAQLALAKATLVSRERSLALAKRQFDVGYSSRLDWAQAQAEYHATAAAVPQLERSIGQQENALAVLVGSSPGTAGGTIARGAPLEQLRVPVIDAGLPSSLLRRRPDVVQAELAAVAADASLAAARDQMLPSIRLNA